jgi:hypothetical protein
MNKAKMIIASCLIMAGCGGMNDGCMGWSAREITGSGQVKRVWKETPMLCPDSYAVDISLGVMRNGVGSVSTQDIVLFVEEKDVAKLKIAAEMGAIIDFTYDVRRETVCVNNKRMTSFKAQ